MIPTDEESASRTGTTRCPAGRPRALVADESGSATVEFLLWVPLFALILMMIADLSLLYMTHARIWDAARDGARRMAIHEMTANEAEDHVAQRLNGGAGKVRITAQDGDEVIFVIEAPVSDVTPFGLYTHALSNAIVARVTMLKEPI